MLTRGLVPARQPEPADDLPPAVRTLLAHGAVPAVRRWLACWLVPTLCVPCLIWPALWNRYPIVFADSGTYLAQAMERFLGWDRPVFYSFFMLPLHLGLTTWPVILVQSTLTVLLLDLTRRALGAGRVWLPVVVLFLALMSWLPWIVSELMPDLFTPLLIPLLGLMLFAPERFRGWRVGAMALSAIFMIATQQSSVPLAIGVLAVFVPWRLLAGRWDGRHRPDSDGRRRCDPDGRHRADPGGWRRRDMAGWRPRDNDGSRPHGEDSWRTGDREGWRRFDLGSFRWPLLVPVLALTAMVVPNGLGWGRWSPSPFGNVFALARVIYDGPGMAALRRDCPDKAWILCPYLERMPATANDFLWAPDSPIMLAGGHKAVSADADAIITAAIRAEPGRLAAAALANTVEQLTRFDSGDGLANPSGIVDASVRRHFPDFEYAVFTASRQSNGTLSVPGWLAAAHRTAALAGIAAALALLPLAWRRRHDAFWFLALALVTLPLGAAITGALSGPFDRYQARIVWLPACIALLSAPSLLTGSRRGV